MRFAVFFKLSNEFSKLTKLAMLISIFILQFLHRRDPLDRVDASENGPSKEPVVPPAKLQRRQREVLHDPEVKGPKKSDIGNAEDEARGKRARDSITKAASSPAGFRRVFEKSFRIPSKHRRPAAHVQRVVTRRPPLTMPVVAAYQWTYRRPAAWRWLLSHPQV